jgi:hypothetical protein
VHSTLRGSERRARGRGDSTHQAELKPELTMTQLEASVVSRASCWREPARAAGGLARGRATRWTVARVTYNTRLQQTLPRLRAAAAEP